jgi:hypothetical protein
VLACSLGEPGAGHLLHTRVQAAHKLHCEWCLA